MSGSQRTQRTFLVATLIAVITVTVVFMVYAALVATYTGKTVTVAGLGGQMQYSLNGTTWLSELPEINNGTAWYARVNMTGAVVQTVTIQWILQKLNGNWGAYYILPTNTTKTLATGINIIYATADGSSTGNYNWGQNTTSGGSYRVQATVYG